MPDIPKEAWGPFIEAGIPGVLLAIFIYYIWKQRIQIDELHAARLSDQSQFLERYLSITAKVESWMQIIQKGHEEQAALGRRGNEILNDLTREIRDLRNGGGK